MFNDLNATIAWIDATVDDNGRLHDANHNTLVEHVTVNEFPLVVFFDKSNGWVIALDEPDKEPFDCYWFVSGMLTKAEAQRVLLSKFQDHTKFRVLKIKKD